MTGEELRRLERQNGRFSSSVVMHTVKGTPMVCSHGPLVYALVRWTLALRENPYL